jgi:hypothetical protein
VRLSTRGRCVSGIRGDGRERGVEHAARRGGRGKKERMAVNFGCQTAKGREMFWAIRSSDGKGLGAI